MIARVKQRADILDVCERLGLIPNRSSFICCPMHGEKTPSLKIYTNSDTWHCFGCGANGDVIDLVGGFYQVDNKQALKILADWYGLKNERMSKIDYRRLKAAEARRKREKEQREREQNFYTDAFINRARIEGILINSPQGSLEYQKALAELAHAEYLMEVAQFDKRRWLSATQNRDR